MPKRTRDESQVAQYLNELPRILAQACSIYGRRHGLPRREHAIYKLIAEHPEIIRIVHDERLEARRAALLERRKMGEGGQI